jgi:2-aminoethylphosphonate dioxygenase
MNYNEILKNYNKKGFAKIGNIIDEDKLGILVQEIFDAKKTISYFDNEDILRRIEKFFNKGDALINCNLIILKLLNDIFSKDFVIFKDKYNAKPPGGEGFYVHYDGIFHWENNEGIVKNGWYEYAPEFVNVLIAIDDSNSNNGTIEIAEQHNLNFEKLLLNTQKNGTPEIIEKVSDNLNFEKINLNKGDAVIFSHRCPHRSGKNNSSNPRRIIYYTYNESKYGDNYKNYFDHKFSSNPSQIINKALSSK